MFDGRSFIALSSGTKFNIVKTLGSLISEQAKVKSPARIITTSAVKCLESTHKALDRLLSMTRRYYTLVNSKYWWHQAYIQHLYLLTNLFDRALAITVSIRD